MLHEFLTTHRAEIIKRTVGKVAARPAPQADTPDRSLGVPSFLDDLVETLQGNPRQRHLHDHAKRQGDDMHRIGYTVAQVVHGYGDVCQAVTELAIEMHAPITVGEFHTLNRCLDNAIADAVTEYARIREQAASDLGNERLGNLAHELRNRVNTAMLSFSILRRGTVSIGGSTGSVLERSLIGLTELIDNALSEVRLEAEAHGRERIVLAEFIEEVEIAAILEAQATAHRLRIAPVDREVLVCGDRQLLSAALGNLLQNAFKFTPRDGMVTLRVRMSPESVWIDVEDECGGLPEGQADELFRPFHQRSNDRSGLGLGLSISRKAVALNGGELTVRDLPGTGCIFTVLLPRLYDDLVDSVADEAVVS